MQTTFLVTGMIMFVIITFGFGALSVQAQDIHGDKNTEGGRVVTKRKASYERLADIQLLKTILAVLESNANQDTYPSQQSHFNDLYQQLLSNANKGYVQGPDRYDHEAPMDVEGAIQQAVQNYYNKLRGTVASGRPGSGGGGSFGGGR